jgi:hypothetical protein
LSSAIRACAAAARVRQAGAAGGAELPSPTDALPHRPPGPQGLTNSDGSAKTECGIHSK